MAERKRQKLRSRLLLAGKTNSQSSAQRLEVVHQEFGVSATVAQSHLIKRTIKQIPNLFEVASRRDQLETTKVFTFWNAIDYVSVVDILVVPG